MQSVTSCFNRAVIRSDWRRFWPLALLYAAVWWLILPVQLLNRVQYLNQFEELAAPQLNNCVYDIMPAAAIVPMILCCLMVMALYNYIMKSSSVGLMHSLPVKRSTLYLSHFVAGMEMLTVGNALTFVLSVLIASAAPVAVPWTPLLLWLLASEVCCIFFFSFAVFSAMLTGWLLLVPVVYVGLNFAVMAVVSLLEALKGLFYFGYIGEAYAPWVNWLTPVINLSNKLTAEYQGDGEFEWLSLPEGNLRVLIVYFIAAVILLWLGFVLYKHRRSESAGDPVAYGWLRPIARQVIGVVGGLGFGFAFYELINWRSAGLLQLMLCQIVAGIICCVAMEMLMRKSFRVLDRKGIVGVIVTVVLIALVCLGLKLDVGGYQSRIPDAEQVESVEISGSFTRTWYNYSDEETIAAALALHEAIVEAYQEDPSVGEWVSNDDYDARDQYVRFNYIFTDGTMLSRAYNLAVTPGSELHQALNGLRNTEEMRYHCIFDFGEPGKSYQFQGGYASCWRSGGNLQLTEKQANELYAMLLEETERTDKVDVLEDTGYFECNIQLDLQQSGQSFYLSDLPCEYEKAAQLLVDWGLADSADGMRADDQAEPERVYEDGFTSF